MAHRHGDAGCVEGYYWPLRHRTGFLLVMLALTIALASGLPGLRLATVLDDQLPRGHPFVEVMQDHPQFGQPLTVRVLLRRHEGDVFQADTLARLWRLTEAMHTLPGVDHERVVSLASERLRHVVVRPWGLESEPLMGAHPPRDAAEIEALRQRVDDAPGVLGFVVSADHSAAVVSAAFLPGQFDERVLLERLRALTEAEGDAAHALHLTGLPVLNGWIAVHHSNVLAILAVSLLIMLGVLLVYLRSPLGVGLVLLAASTSALWGFGLVGWLGHGLDPLVLVVPVLLVARSFSHSIQVLERHAEFMQACGDAREAAQRSLAALLTPGVLGVCTDAAGLLLIAVAPLPVLQKLALFTGFWALALIPANVVLLPVLLSFGRGAPATGARRRRLRAGLARQLPRLAVLGAPRQRRGVGVLLLTVSGLAAFGTGQVVTGSDAEGSALLWPDAEFNRAVRALNDHFPGGNTLELVFEGTAPGAMRSAAALHTMLAVQRHVEMAARPPRATLSFADHLPEVNRLFSGGNPKWLPLDRDEAAVGGAVNALLLGTNIEYFSHLVDLTLRHATVTLWYPDLRPATLGAALASARAAIAAVGDTHPTFRIRLGAGLVALRDALNRTVARAELFITALLACAMLALCSLAYRSVAVACVLLVPVVLASLLLRLAMAWLGIGMDVNTLPVLAITVGIGIDYGIYLLSRLREELRPGEAVEAGLRRALAGTGTAILFTALTVLAGLTPWYFLSALKFQADMGLLLALGMVVNLVTALIVLPYLVVLLRPGFLAGHVAATVAQRAKR